MVKGIDVSHWQGPSVIPDMIKHNGIKYVMIRAGHGITHDDKCESFVKQCEEYGLEYGFTGTMKVIARMLGKNKPRC